MNQEVKKWKEISLILSVFLAIAIMAIIFKNYGIEIEIPDWAY